jgi:hypothetical protein
MAERTLHYANKGFRSQVVAIAPDPSDPRSKRHPTIDKEVNIHQFQRGSSAQKVENSITVQSRIHWESQSGAASLSYFVAIPNLSVMLHSISQTRCNPEK